jgi:predicted component of type VI protein secretion system
MRNNFLFLFILLVIASLIGCASNNTQNLYSIRDDIQKDIKELKINPNENGDEQTTELRVDENEKEIVMLLEYITNDQKEQLKDKYGDVLTIRLYEKGEVPVPE